MKFADVKVGDQLIMEIGRYDDPEYWRMKVTSVTKARFKTASVRDESYVKEWTKDDGAEYPRNRDAWSRTRSTINFETPEIIEAARAASLNSKIYRELNTLEDLILEVKKNKSYKAESSIGKEDLLRQLQEAVEKINRFKKEKTQE